MHSDWKSFDGDTRYCHRNIAGHKIHHALKVEDIPPLMNEALDNFNTLSTSQVHYDIEINVNDVNDRLIVKYPNRVRIDSASLDFLIAKSVSYTQQTLQTKA